MADAAHGAGQPIFDALASANAGESGEGRGDPDAPRKATGVPYWHDARDFEWEDLRARFEPEVRALLEREPPERSSSPTPAIPDSFEAGVDGSGVADTQGQIDGWERHFQKHASAPTPFFKERRGLLQMFPVLNTPDIHVLEIGCGNGSCVLPLLRGNVTATVHATDPARTAVEDTAWRCAEQGLSERLTSEIQPGKTTPCSPEHGPFDHVMILCTLSAIPGEDDAALLASATAALRPGGLVLIRDHGMYDMRHLKDVRRGAVLLDRERPAYLRPGGMHRRYYSLQDMAALAGGAGLEVVENRYLCIRQRNEKKGLEWDRVYVHSVFRRPFDSGDAAPCKVNTVPCKVTPAILHGIPCKVTPAILHGTATPDGEGASSSSETELPAGVRDQ